MSTLQAQQTQQAERLGILTAQLGTERLRHQLARSHAQNAELLERIMSTGQPKVLPALVGVAAAAIAAANDDGGGGGVGRVYAASRMQIASTSVDSSLAVSINSNMKLASSVLLFLAAVAASPVTS